MENIRENHNQLKCKVVEPSHCRYIYKILLLLRLRGHCRRGGQEECKSQRIRDFALRPYLLVVSEDIPIKSHQHDYPM